MKFKNLLTQKNKDTRERQNNTDLTLSEFVILSGLSEI